MTSHTEKVIARFPPSPTGPFHVGSARTALFNFLFAKQKRGTLLLRSEDTDNERSKREFEEEIIEGLRWLGIEHEPCVRQSERTALYTKHLNILLENGTAYISKEPAKDNLDEEIEIVRFKNPNKEITFTDTLRGDITFDTTDLGDFVIARSITDPLYHLAVVVDDFDMGVTHVIRGEDGISNTPRQILLQEALGAPRPVYTHIPLVLGKDKSKLSKRHGGASIREYRDLGYLPEALVNFLAFLGWNPGDDKEIMSLGDLVEAFDITHVQKGGAVFNIEKLNWYNQEYLRKKKPSEILELARPFIPESIQEHHAYRDEKMIKILPILLERDMVKLSDVTTLGEAGELAYFFEQPNIDPEKLLWKKEQSTEKTKERLQTAHNLLTDTSFDSIEILKNAIWDFAEKEGKGEVLWPLRFALSGKDKSPDPFSLLFILGKEESLSRISSALKLL